FVPLTYCMPVRAAERSAVGAVSGHTGTPDSTFPEIAIKGVAQTIVSHGQTRSHPPSQGLLPAAHTDRVRQCRTGVRAGRRRARTGGAAGAGSAPIRRG